MDRRSIQCRCIDEVSAMATQFASSSSPQLKKSRVRVSSAILIHLLFFIFNILNVSSLSSSKISYREHCNSIVPESNPDGLAFSPAGFLKLDNSYYIGGEKILDQNPQSSFNFQKSVDFRIRKLYDTDDEGVLNVEGVLVFLGANGYPVFGNWTYGKMRHSRFRTRRHRFPVNRGGLRFKLQGFWSASAGQLCMVGSGSGYSKEGNLLDLSAVFKLNYPKTSTIFTSLVNGTLESLDTADSSNYFEPISVLAFSQRSYNYTLISKENASSCSGGDDGREKSSLSLESGNDICSILTHSTNRFELEYGSDCDAAKNCTPLGTSIGFLPSVVSFSGVQCSDKHRLRLLMGFSNDRYYGYSQPLDPNTTLVGEGVWDGKKNQLCLVACRILDPMNSLVKASIGDCSTRLSLRFPAMLSIKSRSSIVGQIWSNRTTNDSSHFDRIVLRNSESGMMSVPGLKYDYTETAQVMKLCAKKKAAKHRGKKYPNGYSYDMRFDMLVKASPGNRMWGYSVPLSVGDQFYEHYLNALPVAMSPGPAVQLNANHDSLLNISYKISFTPPPNSKLASGLSLTNMSMSLNNVEISAEGIYDTETGGLCMLGCRYLGSNRHKSKNNDSMDCRILINVQFPPLNAKSGDYVKGTIESIRESTDPLYFERLEVSSTSMSTTEAEASIWRMDLEITMVLISNTLFCIFVGLQLFYVKKHPDVLPLISLVMLVILTLGYMIPLLLNFEALFLTNHNRQNVLIESGGWLEVNEVMVRVVTMVAFLFQFRLLQLAWSTRLGDGNRKELWVAEKKALYVSLPLYLVGGLIAWILHWWNTYYEAPSHYRYYVGTYPQHSLLGDLRSYAGLVLDSFLLPQILLNLFRNSKDKVLSPAFYVGITAVRLLPHAYDLYRVHSYVPYYDVTYIYANPSGDFFSTAWDVIIPCAGLLFAVLIYLQQRFGGCCIVPLKFREFAVYEKVPAAGGE